MKNLSVVLWATQGKLSFTGESRITKQILRSAEKCYILAHLQMRVYICRHVYVCLCAWAHICFLPGFIDQQSNSPVASNCLISTSIVLNPVEDELDTLYILKDPQFLRNQERNNLKCKESFSFILRVEDKSSGQTPANCSGLCSLILALPHDHMTPWPRDQSR